MKRKIYPPLDLDECRRIMAEYPDGHPQKNEIAKQIHNWESLNAKKEKAD